MKAVMRIRKNETQTVNHSNSLFKQTKFDSVKYSVSDWFKSVYLFVVNIAIFSFNFLRKYVSKIVQFFTFKGMLEKASHSVDETINNKKKRVNFQTTVGILTFATIFAGTSLVASAADAPEQIAVIDSDGFNNQTVAVTSEAILPDVIKEAVKTLYVEPKPLVDISTYGPESSDFVNNPNGIVQWPFWRGVHISDHFGERPAVCESGCEATTSHSGTDFGAGAGAEVGAIADGVVAAVVNFEGNVLGSGDMTNSAGTHIMIKHNIDGQDVYSLYAHLQYNSIPLKAGDSVVRGQLIGKVGNTGMSTAAHLHLGIRINGKYVDAEPFLIKYNAINIPR